MLTTVYKAYFLDGYSKGVISFLQEEKPTITAYIKGGGYEYYSLVGVDKINNVLFYGTNHLTANDLILDLAGKQVQELYHETNNPPKS
jgi:hypothetical protein